VRHAVPLNRGPLNGRLHSSVHFYANKWRSLAGLLEPAADQHRWLYVAAVLTTFQVFVCKIANARTLTYDCCAKRQCGEHGSWRVAGWKYLKITQSTLYLSVLGTCIMEHLEVLENSWIFISNPDNRILFRNNLLGVKWADRAEFENAHKRLHNLLISSLRHYAVPCWVFLSLAQGCKECHCKIYWNYLFCQLNFSRLFNPNLFGIQIFENTLIFWFDYWRIRNIWLDSMFHCMHPQSVLYGIRPRNIRKFSNAYRSLRLNNISSPEQSANKGHQASSQ